MIGTASIVLTPLGRQHVDRTLEWTNDPELARLLNRSRRVTPDEHRAWFDRLAERADARFFAVELPDGRHVGNVWLADINPLHRKAEMRIVIGDRDCGRRGIGTEAIARLCDLAFADLGLQRIYAYVLEINPRAKRAFEKAGFAVEGVLRRDRSTEDGWVDVFLLARLK